MGRTATKPGSHTEPEATPYRTDPVSGQRKRAANARQATLWRARCTAVTLDGSRRDVTRWAKTKREALDAVRSALADVTRVTPGSLLKPSMPFIDAGRIWLEQIKRPASGASAATIDAYERAFRVHIDAPGSLLRGVTLSGANDVQVILAYLQGLADASGPGIVKRVRTILSNILGMAVERGVLPYNAVRLAPAVRSVKPEAKRDHSRAFTTEERQAVIATADGKASKFAQALAVAHEADAKRDVYRLSRSAAKWDTVADLVAFLAGTGVRLGEARLMRWEDLNLSRAHVIVRGTKTASSERDLNLPAWLVDRLRARALRRGAQGLVFASADGPEVPMDHSNLETSVRSILNEAGMPWAISHTFRRTVATMLHEGGVPLSKIADQLGHANPRMTAEVYLGRDFKGDKAELAALL